MHEFPCLQRIYEIGDRYLSQQHLPDDMARLDMIGEDRGDARAAGGQARCEGGIVELDADDERRRLDFRRGHGKAGYRGLPGRNRLQDCLNAASIDLPWKRLECDFGLLPALDITGIDLRNLGAEHASDVSMKAITGDWPVTRAPFRNARFVT